MPRKRLVCFVLLFPALVRGSAVGARIEGVEARGFVLRIAGALLRVEEGPGVRYWRGTAPAAREDFARGEEVVVRLDPSGRVARLREMADPAGADWLDARRGGVSRGRIAAVAKDRLTLALAGGATFGFALSRATVLPLGGALSLGEEVWVRGRGSESLEGVAAEVSRTPLEARKVTVRGEERIAEGIVRLVSPQGDEIVLAPVEGEGEGEIALPIAASTPIWDEGRRLPRAALARGVRLRATWTVGSNGRARVRRIELLRFP